VCWECRSGGCCSRWVCYEADALLQVSHETPRGELVGEAEPSVTLLCIEQITWLTFFGVEDRPKVAHCRKW
jgi:hypothetical protein